MATTHAISVVKNHCYTAPRISKTDRPATTLDLNQGQIKRDYGQKTEATDEESEVSTRMPTRTVTVSNHAHPKHRNTSLSYEQGDAISEEQFYQNLMSLKEEHKKTLKLLETRYYEELRNRSSFQWEGFSNGVGLKQKDGSVQGSEDGFDLSADSLYEYSSRKFGDRVLHKPPKSPAVHDAVKDMSHSTMASGNIM